MIDESQVSNKLLPYFMFYINKGELIIVVKNLVLALNIVLALIPPGENSQPTDTNCYKFVTHFCTS